MQWKNLDNHLPTHTPSFFSYPSTHTQSKLPGELTHVEILTSQLSATLHSLTSVKKKNICSYRPLKNHFNSNRHNSFLFQRANLQTQISCLNSCFHYNSSDAFMWVAIFWMILMLPTCTHISILLITLKTHTLKPSQVIHTRWRCEVTRGRIAAFINICIRKKKEVSWFLETILCLKYDNLNNNVIIISGPAQSSLAH